MTTKRTTSSGRRAGTVDAEHLEVARSITRRLLGATLEAKATDEFCVRIFGTQSHPEPVSREVFIENVVGYSNGPRLGGPMVIEFGSSSSISDSIDPKAMRESRISATRTAAYHALSDVHEEIERQSGMAPLSPPDRDDRFAPSPTTQICWLNHTMRTWADPSVVAEVSDDPNVASVDIPRRLRADVSGGGGHQAIGLTPEIIDRFGDGSGVTIAVIDTEVAARHPALKGRVVHRRNYTKESWGNPNKHATAIAGIIASSDLNFPGIARGVTIYNYKVLATNSFINSDDFAGSIAIQNALEDGMDAANCSWGAGPVGAIKSREALALDTAWETGMTVVKSAGNDGPGRPTMTTPADADGGIVVGATDLVGKSVEPYSSRGTAGNRAGPDCVAPGGSNDPDSSDHLDCALVSGGFGFAGAGTSYAAPMVTGLVALLIEKNPLVTPDELRDHIRATAVQIPRIAASTQGAGVVQAIPWPTTP